MRLTVGVLYPPRFHPDHESYVAATDALRELDPAIGLQVEVVEVAYEDSSERRTRRSSPAFVRGADDVDELSPEQLDALARIDVALALDLPFDVAALAPRLVWVQSVGAGIGQLRSAGLAEHGIRLTNATGTSAPEMAEFVVARILEHWKQLAAIRAAQDEHRWSPRYGRRLAGSTIGLVGFGGINREVGRLAEALGMKVLVTRSSNTPDELAAMVAASDVVVAAVPETPRTMAMFDQHFFGRMRPGAFFVNVGRGSSVVDGALQAALTSGHLGGAALDVFNHEPLADDDPYWTTAGVQVSAHCSSVPRESILRVHELFRENLRRFAADEELLNLQEV